MNERPTRGIIDRHIATVCLGASISTGRNVNANSPLSRRNQRMPVS